MIKVKLSLYKSRQTQRVPGGMNTQISNQHKKGGKVVSPMHRPPLPPQEVILALISFGCTVDPRTIVRPEGLSQYKNPNDPTYN